MQASAKCSNCGAKMSNLTFSWGKKQWLWGLLTMIPLFGFMWWSITRLDKAKHDYRQELRIQITETLITDEDYTILGTVENTGEVRWERIELEAEFYDADGNFLDEFIDYVNSSIDAGRSEHFKFAISSPSEDIRADGVRMDLKIADAYTSIF